MIEHLWSVICSRSVIDNETNNVSIQNIIEEVSISQPQDEGRLNIGLPFEVFTVWEREDNEKPISAKGRLTYISPQGEELGSTEYLIIMEHHIRSRNRVRFPSLPVQGPGIYKFLIHLQLEPSGDWELKYSLPLKVSYQIQEKLIENTMNG